MLRHLQPGDTAVDIGAWRGAYTYWMVKAVGPQGRVVCFEPQPAMISYLRKIKRHAAPGYGWTWCRSRSHRGAATAR